MNKVCYAALAAIGVAVVFQPAASAAPLRAAPLSFEQPYVIEVQGQRGARGAGPRAVQRGPRVVQRGSAGVRSPRVVQRGYTGPRAVYRGGTTYSGPRVVQRSPRIVQRGGYAYWGSHRGYRVYRPGYYQYGGWWFPPAAFAVGAILGGAIAGQTYGAPVVGLSAAHYQWCAQRFISYRASDNSFQPYHGPRQQCISPYS